MFVAVKSPQKDQNLSTPARTAVAPKPVSLTIFVNKDPNEGIRYDFDKKETVIYDQSELTVNLVIGADGNTDPMAQVHISGYCKTETDGGVVWAETHGPISDPKKTRIQTNPDGSLDRFSTDAMSLTLKFRLSPLKMVLIGIIVAVKRDGESGYTDYLCDPQVGNGPPPATGSGIGSNPKTQNFLIPIS
jgi:hypothetical protein